MSKFSLNVTINPETNQLLFIEADAQFVDVLLSFFTLPLGKILALFKRHYRDNIPTVGSLTTLYNSLADLDAAHFWTDQGKQMLLNPRNVLADECRKLKLNLDDTTPADYFKFYTCEDFGCSFNGYASDYVREICMYSEKGYGRCRCGEAMTKKIEVRDDSSTNAKVVNKLGDQDGVFMRKVGKFLIGDDLKMYPNSWTFFIKCLSSLGLSDAEGLQQKTVLVGLPEIIDLLKGLFISPNPFTDVLLKNGSPKMASTQSYAAKHKARLKPGINFEKDASSGSSKSILVKVMLQKSTKKLLFVQSKHDFVEFLLSLLAIPLGSAARLFVEGYDDHDGRLSNLYKSIEVLDEEHYLTPKKKTMLLDLKLHPSYLSDKQLLPLKEQDCIELYYYKNIGARTEYLTRERIYKRQNLVSLKDPKGSGSYLRNPGMFMVRDDLTVSCWTMASSIKLLNEMNVPLHDVEEVEVEVGVKEGLGILEASMSSKVALSDCLKMKIASKLEGSKASQNL